MDANNGSDVLMNPWAWAAYGLAVIYLFVVIKGLVAWRKELRQKGQKDGRQ